MQARQRSGRFQTDINVSLALSKQQSVTAGSGGGSPSSGGIAAVMGGAGGTGSGGTGSGGGEGGGVYCFAGYTLVRMADGIEKPIRETVLYRDIVAVPTTSGTIESGRIIHRSETMYSSWLRIFFEAETSPDVVEVQPNHRYRTESGEYAEISELDRVLHLNEQGLWVVRKIYQKVFIRDRAELDFYNFGVSHPAKAYIAAGDWVSNAKPQGGNEV